MAKELCFKPDWVSAPGETIREVLREQGISAEKFCTMLDRPELSIDELFNGQLELTENIAKRLSGVLGGSTKFWLTREAHFREALRHLEFQAEDEVTREWINTIPIRDMAGFGWVRPADSLKEKVGAALRFFGVPNLESWERRYRPVLQCSAMRTSPSFDSDPSAVAVWLRQGEIEASQIRTSEWCSDLFEASLVEIRTLTRHPDPERFLPELVEICAKAGVSLVVLKAPKGCRASGATRFGTDGRPMILLSGRHLSEDHFWFTFFHEAGHLILHGDREFFLDFDSSPSSPEEVEANSFAHDVLVPEQYRREFFQLRNSLRDVARFARRVELSAGVVIGQLQHCEVLKRSWLNTAKRRYAWEGTRLVAKS